MSDGNGALPEGWAWAKLPEVGELNRGKSRHRPRNAKHLYGGPHPFVQTGDIAQSEGRITSHRQTYSEAGLEQSRLWPAGTIAITIAANIASSAILSYPACFPDSVVGLIPDSETTTAPFVEYFIRTARADLEQYAPATAQKNINLGILKNVHVPLPPLPEQRRIVSKIESLQERSACARNALSEVGPLLEQFRQSVLRAAFSGRLTADWREANPDVEPATELLSRIRTERRERWEQSELAKYEAKGKQPPKGWQDRYDSKQKKAVRATVADVRAEGVAIDEVPDGWELARLGDIANLQAGYAFKSKWFTETGIRLLRGTNIEPGSTRWTETVHLPAGQADEYVEYLLNDGDVVIAMDRPVISTGLKVTRISEADLPALLLQRVGRFQVEDRITPEFIYQFVQSPFFMRHIGVQATGTQLPHISSNDIESAILPLPPLDEQVAIVESVSRSLEAVDEVETALTESESDLTQLDQSILAKAFRGELVPQDPRDEPALVLLERIRAARDHAVSKKQPRKRAKAT